MDGGGFGSRKQQKSKSPKGGYHKRAFSNKIGLPKKKAKLRLEPLANRNAAGLTYNTQQHPIVEADDPLRVSKSAIQLFIIVIISDN